MRQPTASRVAWSTVGASAILSGVALVLIVRSGESRGVFQVVSPTTVGAESAIGLGMLVYPVVGALIASRRPENRIGWLFCTAGVVLGLVNVAGSYAFHTLDTNPGSLPGGAGAAVVSDALWVPAIAFTSVFLFLLFPHGRLQTRAERVTARVTWAAIALSVTGVLVEPSVYAAPDIENPLPTRGPEALSEVLQSVGFLLLIGAVVASLVLLIARFRRSRGQEHEQMQWFVWSAGVVLILVLPTNVVDSPPLPLQLASGAAVMLLPVSVGVAILRKRLYDLDLVLSKAFVYALLGAFITVVYVTLVVGVGAAVGSRSSVVLSGIAAAVVALAFQPARARAQRVANRLVYGARATPYEVLSSFSERLAGVYSVDDVLPRMARVLAEGTGAARTGVWLREGGTFALVASWPSDAAPDRTALSENELASASGEQRAFPVRHQGETLGAITVVIPPGETMGPAQEALFANVADQAGLMLSNVRLVGDLRTSRERLVAAQDEERRRIERNIHDGAQQQLVALSVRLRLADSLVGRDDEKAHELLVQLQTETQEALEDLRELARGIYPPLLADRGLVAAVEAQARKSPLPVSVRAEDVGRPNRAVEAAAYFCVLEALQNAAKYANASSVVVDLARRNGALVFSIADDGVGFDPVATRPGSGLTNMRDRLEALGGSVKVRSNVGRGTRIEGRIPVGEVTT